MDISPTAVAVYPLENHEILVEFETGVKKKYDVKPHIKGSWYGELSNVEYFKTVKCNGHTVEWENGQDICPDDLYVLSVEAHND